MLKKIIWLCTLVTFSTASGVAITTQSAAAESYGSPRTLIGIKYTHTTPVRSRGTWYNWDKEVGASKVIVKKHQVKWYSRPHKTGKWHHDNTLTGKKLLVYRETERHRKTFGFYHTYQDDYAFWYTGTKKHNDKTVKYMKSSGLYDYYKKWQYAIH
ncbi:hypothetical protein [Levilactobacillus cerevisiae]|uniref:hypothetical protein n=1 Tax=Levilactobacillus cerevisiae TaxID=1704076 RepID=UPI000F791677|nr:hypothetical protein [Levilactobacillus cerevisiae]